MGYDLVFRLGEKMDRIKATNLSPVVLAFVGMMTIQKFTKKKIYEENVKSVDLIKKHLGAKNFEKLLDRQKSYMDEYFDALYPEDEENEEVLEENVEKNEENIGE